MATWVSNCKDIYRDPSKIALKSKFMKNCNNSYNYRYSHYFYNNTKILSYYRNSKINHTDTLIYTDGSYEFDHEEKFDNFHEAGIGIYVSNSLDEYHFFQALGSHSIFYAEMYAIAILENLLIKLNLSLSDRIEIFCDNQSVFESIYKKSKDEIYPILLSKCRDLINKYQVVFHKVKSHVPYDPVLGNDIADKLAKKAISLPFNHLIPRPWFSWLNSFIVRKDFRCYEQTVLWDTLDPG